ncbi:hypothetical protein [Acidovorax sp. NCPPB 3576]|uniref:hypothetical protein n=1 Tax=Acidovorax sp. NCPPB 3576 TaxID=2940488 RepID=UPI00234A2A86|nr:hypothetical protein [Acidovorax sp. NCPPB 3576]WCM89700.1 hypothetical protein M5C98_06565 [Acidovorax sp. NCPPB 3576]
MASDPVRIALLGAPGTGLEALTRAVARHLDPGHAMVDACPALHAAVSRCLEAPVGPSREKEEARQALAALAATHAVTCHATLLCGLDGGASSKASGQTLQPSGQERFDACLREALSEAGVAYRVLYGSGDERLRATLDAIKKIASKACNPLAGTPFDPEKQPRPARLRAWSCEKCSDPECEHKLFTALRG